MKNDKLGILGVALMYVGAIMGAGFASGREIWQFFAVFGTQAYVGVIVVGALFMILGMMTSTIARRLHTNDMGKVIVPGNHPALVNFVGYFMALMLFTVLITMSAAAGALVHQQFGMSRILGGAILICMVIITVIGGFDRVARVFRFMMPVLFAVVVSVCLLVIFTDLPPSGATAVPTPSPLAPNWALASVLYISYNILAVIPIVATASVNAKCDRYAIFGTGLGGIFLGLLAFLLATALLTDPSLSQSMDMPMLAFSARLNRVANIIYICVLFFAVYSSATSNYYGVTTKLKDSRRKKMIIIVLAWLGFACGLIGFTNVIAYMFPVEGFLGIAIIAMVVINFIKTGKNRHDERGKIVNENERVINEKAANKPNELFGDFEGHDRFDYPEGIVRVTAGRGGEALLILSRQKTALVDCGMAYCGDEMLQNLKIALDGRTLDYVFMSHTHYDHIGAFPYVKREWPQVVSVGAQYAKKVFDSPNAIALMGLLGTKARDIYTDSKAPILTDGFCVDRIVREGDEIELGGKIVRVLETPGHTNCSLTYILEPDGIMFASESTGVLGGPGYIHTAILKSYRDSMASVEKCCHYPIKHLVSPHYGMVPNFYIGEFWRLFKEDAELKRDFVLKLYDMGMDKQAILAAFDHEYWRDIQSNEQPKAAFMENAGHIIDVIVREFRKNVSNNNKII